ncbi:MAG: DNA-processing protein DprA [Methylococcaceae bacterium]|nr:DNA-processing protein DprA [Methylococcaceae bacterium]
MAATAGADLRFRLALLRAPGVGPRTYQALIERLGSPAAVFAESPADLSALGLGKSTLEWLQNPDWRRIENDLRWLELPGHHCLDLGDAAYPKALREIPDPPPLLFVDGEPAALQARQLAVVGSRNPSPIGERMAGDFARALVQAGFAVTSGLALGIDGAAHRGALSGGGLTLAVAGTGLDQVYPRRHRFLAEQILDQGGALISEFPLGTPPQAGNFPRRNRIISGLSLGVLVVEAAARSGSLITARMALEQGREVFALPGSINDPLARGCNALIKQGAKLVETVTDILEEFAAARLPLQAAVYREQHEEKLDPECHALLKYIAYAPTSVDTLVAATGKTPEAISSLLLLLELQGYVVSASGGFSRIR